MSDRRVTLGLRWVRSAVFTLVLGVLLLGVSPTIQADELPPLRVVATFSVLGDMVKEIGGRHVSVVTIVGPNADAHSFEPTPQTVKELANAQVLVSNGLNFETWLPRLVKSSGFSGTHIVASKGATLRTFGGDVYEGTVTEDTGTPEHDHGSHDHAHHPGELDPHAWQNLENGMVYARNISDGLASVDPVRAPNFLRRVKKYLTTMQKLDVEVKAALGAIPQEHRKAVVAHDAFGYFGDAYGVTFIALAALGDAAEPSAKDIAAVIDRVRNEQRVAVFPETISSPKLIEQLAREADVVMGEPLFSDALDMPDEPAGTYLGMFHWNAGQLISVLRSNEASRSP